MIKIFAVNPFRQVCYIVSDDSSKKCVIIDCGATEQFEFDRITDYISKNELTPIMALNTHAHIDHILGINKIKELYNIPFAVSSLDTPTLSAAPISAKMYGLVTGEFEIPTIDIDIKDMEEIEIGDTKLKIIPTPGHTSGGVTFYLEDEGAIFTGDTLFKGSIGRTDLPTGDYNELMHSIINNLLPLAIEKDIVVYPGHGNHTTIGEEVATNPFVNEVLNDKVNPKMDY
ncbi:MAG: MBL fold metallo-hydrolase [Rikenellaceae bacterium]